MPPQLINKNSDKLALETHKRVTSHSVLLVELNVASGDGGAVVRESLGTL